MLKRFFGIIRMSGRCGDKPTATSFLELFRLFSLYYPTKHILRGSNCDDKEEQQVLLTSYTSWMKQQFKCNKQKLIEKKKYFNDILLKGITREIQLQNDSSPEEPTMLDDSANGKKLDVLDFDRRSGSHEHYPVDSSQPYRDDRGLSNLSLWLKVDKYRKCLEKGQTQRAREDKYRRSEFSLGNSASDLGLYRNG
ncbi:hypothetical protein OUZ56_028919 [Daphnia magna]|uniref:Uncharacterized protein n=1 Tax=Daphnia magna TaxID=35525 RepID=A0ABR0B5B6_9CRUS|nr:hypothetical protein OUZ56_028919 [Daphnia magna]